MYAYPTRPIPLGHGYPTLSYRTPNAVDVAGAGRNIDTLVPVWICVQALHAI